MGLLDKVKEGNALSDIKENTKKNRTIEVKKEESIESIKAIKEEKEELEGNESKKGVKVNTYESVGEIGRKNSINQHLTNGILRDLKSDLLDEVKLQEYIYKTISKRFEIIAKNNKVPKYLIINSVLAQFLKENNDDVQEEIKLYKKKINDF